MTGPLKLVVRLSKPKQSASSSDQQNHTANPSNKDKPSKPRKREDSNQVSAGPRASGPYYDASPPLPLAKKHKGNTDVLARHDSSIGDSLPKPPKLQLKLSTPSQSAPAHFLNKPVSDKHGPASDAALSLRLPIKLSLGASGGNGSTSRNSFDGNGSKKRKPEVQSPVQPGDDVLTSGTAKKLKLPSGTALHETPSKSGKQKQTRSKGGASKKSNEPTSQSQITFPASTLEETSQQDVQSSEQAGLLKSDATAKLSQPFAFVESAMAEAPTRSELEKLVDKIQKKDASDIFRDPVTEAIAPGYFSVISKPMDFTTIRQKIASEAYDTWDLLEEDITVMFNNAMTYNSPDTPYYRQARTLLDVSRKLMDLARQGVTNFRGRTAGIVRAHNAKIAAEERAEKEAQHAAARAEKVAARKVVEKGTPASSKTVALNAANNDRAAAKPDVSEAPKVRNNARPIVRENDGRRPLHNEENVRITYKPVAEIPAAKWGSLVNGASAEGVMFASDCHHVRFQQHQASKDCYLTSMARFVLSCSKNVQDYILNRIVDCVPVEAPAAKAPITNLVTDRLPQQYPYSSVSDPSASLQSRHQALMNPSITHQQQSLLNSSLTPQQQALLKSTTSSQQALSSQQQALLNSSISSQQQQALLNSSLSSQQQQSLLNSSISSQQQQALLNSSLSSQQQQALLNSSLSSQQQQALLNSSLSSQQQQALLNSSLSSQQQQALLNSSLSSQQQQALLNSSISSQQQQHVGGLGGTSGLVGPDKSLQDAAPQRLGNIHGMSVGANSLQSTHGRNALTASHGLLPALHKNMYGAQAMLYPTTGALQQAGNRSLPNFHNNHGKVPGGTAPSVMSAHAMYQSLPPSQTPAGFPNIYNLGSQSYFGANQAVQNMPKPHDSTN